MPRLLRVLFLGLLTFWAQASLCCAESPVLRVGYFDSPLYLTQDATGDYVGTIYENVETAMSYAGYRTKYVRVAPEDAVDALRSGRIDVLAGVVSRAPSNTEIFDMVDRVIASTPVYLSRPSGSEPPHRRLRVGYHTSVYGALVDFYRAKPEDDDFASFELVPYDDMELFYQDFRRGAVDAALSSDFQPDTAIPIERTLFPANIYLAVRPGDDVLRENIEAGIEKALSVDPTFRERSALDRADSTLVLSQEERAFLASHPVIRVASSGHQPPLTYFEGDTVKGVIRDIYDRFEHDLGVRVEIIQAKNNAEVMELLTAGKIDLAAHINANHNRANKMNMRLTMPYLEFAYMPVTRRHGTLPEKPRVACPKKHFFIQNYVRRNYPEENILWLDTFSECYDAVSDGRADLLFAKSISVFQELDSEKYYNLQTTGQNVAKTRMAMAVSADANPMLLGIVNKEIAHIGRRGVDEIVGRYMADTQTGKSWKAYIYENPLPAVGAALAVAFAVAGAAVYALRVREESTKELFKAAYVNPFTGIHTMRWFERFVPKLIEKEHKKERQAGRLYLMSLRTHRFDLLKATYDQRILFAGIARLAKETRRKNPWLLYDSISSELSQMCILFRQEAGMTPYEAADKMMEDAAEIKGDNISIHMTYHIGICDIPKEGALDLPMLMTNAAVACNEADAHGELIGIYDESLQKRRVLEKKIEDLMYKALEEEEFQVWLQPKYDLRTHRVIGAEALVRWQSPELGFLMPYQFIGLFEKNGFIIPFDYYMLEHVCRLQKNYEKAGLQVVPIAVNQSGLHMREAGYVKRMGEIQSLYPLPHGAVELELTETAFIDYDTKTEGADAPSIVAALREMGYAIAMDDFCTGYSSISMLQRLPMDIMKIDRAMLLASENSPRGQKILRNVVNFGQSLDMLVLCEGIETEQQEEMLLDNGCVYGQGFLFSRPMPNEKYADFISEHGTALHESA